jgi:uncharacterized protein YqjF (DUF2071 family)
MSAVDLDRITPTRPPADRSPSGWQNWRNLLFLHWPIEPAALRAAVPRELELDLWGGEAFVGVVPFEMKQIRPSWLPGAFAMDFLETNLRTYVHYRGEPGVYFFSLEASSRLAVQAARWGWGLPYHYAAMSSESAGGGTHYRSVRSSNASARLDVRYHVGEPIGASPAGSFEHFLLERYYLFSTRGGRVSKGHVHHVPYPAQRAEVESIDEGLIVVMGFERLGERFAFVHFVSGVDVEVFGPWALE